MNLKVDVKDDEAGTKVIQLTGEIDVYTAPNLKEALIPLTEKEGLMIQVDFSNVHYMDSIGLGVFISALKSSQLHHSILKLINVHERISRLFNITGLDELIDIESANRSEQNRERI